MGSCFSSSSSFSSQPTAKVIALDGSLKEYSVPIPASNVLGGDCGSCFVCSSDRLYFDAYIPALGVDELLQLGQIYFVLPIAKLEYQLTGLDMAALAAKASSALVAASKKRGKGRSIRVMPVAEEVCEGVEDRGVDGFERFDDAKVEILAERSVATKKVVARRIYRRGRTPSPRFRGKLSTIEEADEQ